MNLIHCRVCGQYCFTDTQRCPKCLTTFKPGELQAQANLSEKAFLFRSRMAFLAGLLISLVGFLVITEMQFPWTA
jgi:hypothetical protein